MKPRVNPIGRAIISVAIAVLFFGGLMYATGDAIAGSDGGCYCPNCGSCGLCPTNYNLYPVAAAASNETNASITFYLSSSSGEPNGVANVNFGLNTSYLWPAATTVGVGGMLYPTTVSVGYLAPNLTYDYKVSASASCTDTNGHHNYAGSTIGTWTDKANTMGAVSGYFTNTTGSPAPVGSVVTLYCYSSSGVAIDNNYGWTTTAGYYSLYLPSFAVNRCTGGLALNFFTQNNKNGNNWNGNFNVTFLVYTYGDYNIVVPQIYVSPYYPIGVGPSNVMQTNGAAGSYITYTQGTTLTTSSTTCWQLFWLFTGCVASATSAGASKSYSAENESLNVDQRFLTTGTMGFVAMTRATNISVDRYATFGNPLSPGPAPIPTFMTPQNFTEFHLYYVSGWGTGGQGQFIQYQYPIGGSVTTSTVTETVGVQSVDFSIGVDIYDVDISTSVADVTWSQTATETQSNTLSWEAFANGSNGECFVVYGEGGSQSSNTADAIGLWAYTPNGGPGGSNCPDP